MDSSRWQKVQSLFHEAADLPEAAQRAFLDDRCGEDPELLGQVLGLLREDQQGDALLEGGMARVAEEVLEEAGTAPRFARFGRYRILKELGAGGMGIVYLAERQDLGGLVAIKILRDAWLSPARRERFAIEERTLAQLTHPSIARLYDAGSSPDGTPFFVMEYVEGVPLGEYCDARGAGLEVRLNLFRAVCEAVVYAHQRAVIHRDLKPSNILVKEDGTVRLLDFGIAKQLEALGESVDQTLTGLRLMTPAYASPEQIRGEPVGIQTDVYSLGVVLYELLCGRLPFDLSSRTPAQAGKVLAEQEAERPSAAAGGTGRSRPGGPPGPTSTFCASPRCTGTRTGATARSRLCCATSTITSGASPWRPGRTASPTARASSRPGTAARSSRRPRFSSRWSAWARSSPCASRTRAIAPWPRPRARSGSSAS